MKVFNCCYDQTDCLVVGKEVVELVADGRIVVTVPLAKFDAENLEQGVRRTIQLPSGKLHLRIDALRFGLHVSYTDEATGNRSSVVLINKYHSMLVEAINERKEELQ